MHGAFVDGPEDREILNASVYLYHNLIQLVHDWRFLQTSPADPEARKVILDEDVLGDCIRYVVSHEVGHCLALMHNMSGSAAIPTDRCVRLRLLKNTGRRIRSWIMPGIIMSLNGGQGTRSETDPPKLVCTIISRFNGYIPLC